MAVYADRVKETTSTTGTGTYALLGAVTGFQTFLSGAGNGQLVTYCCEDGTNWEIGEGSTFNSYLTRTTILASSNAGAVVTWGAGTKNIFLTAPAARLVTSTNIKTVGGTSIVGTGDIPIIGYASILKFE